MKPSLQANACALHRPPQSLLPLPRLDCIKHSVAKLWRSRIGGRPFSPEICSIVRGRHLSPSAISASPRKGRQSPIVIVQYHSRARLRRLLQEARSISQRRAIACVPIIN